MPERTALLTTLDCFVHQLGEMSEEEGVSLLNNCANWEEINSLDQECYTMSIPDYPSDSNILVHFVTVFTDNHRKLQCAGYGSRGLYDKVTIYEDWFERAIKVPEFKQPDKGEYYNSDQEMNRHMRIWEAKCRERGAGSDIVNSLIQHGYDLNCIDPSTGMTLLSQAIASNRVDIVAALVRMQSVEINRQIVTRRTPFDNYELESFPLMKAVDCNNIECARILIQSPNINLNEVDIEGNTPLIIACAKGDIEMARLLFENGACFSHLNGNLESAYDMLLENGYVELAEKMQLIDKGKIKESMAGLVSLDKGGDRYISSSAGYFSISSVFKKALRLLPQFLGCY